MDTSHLVSTALQLQSPWKVGSVDFRDADGGRQAWAVEMARHLTITHHKQRMFFYLLRYCVFCTPHVRNVGIPPKFYLPGICLGGSQSAVATRFLVVVPYGVGLSLQIEVRKLALNPEFEKVKGP